MREWLRGFALWVATGFRAAPGLATVSLFLSIGEAVQVPVQTYGLKLVVDGLTGHQSGTLYTGGALLVATLLFWSVMGALDSGLWGTMIDRVHGYLHADLIRLTTGIPSIEHHERPEIADRIGLLHKKSRQMSFNVMQMLFVIVALLNAAAVLALLASVDTILLVLPLLGLIRLWTGFLDGKLRWGAVERTTKYTRLADRLSEIAKSPLNAVEVRVFGLRPVLIGWLDSLLGRVQDERLNASRKGTAYEVGARLVFGIAYALAILYIAVRAKHGEISPGDVALVVLLGSRIDQAAGMIANSTRGAGETIRMFVRYAWLRNYAREAAWAESKRRAPEQLRRGIVLRGVEFRYPGAERPVLADVDLDLAAGSTVALVGENGAGKTTLVKLLTRLYDPTAGAVLVDGQDLREIDPNSWRERTSAGFQDFVKFEFLARQAVGVGHLPRIDSERDVRAALARGDATTVVDKLHRGVDTQLGKRFSNGIELSGGQWQRLALARAFMRMRPLLLVLDEPTAALDPEAEHALFDRFATASREAARRTGGITVLVSHRFSTVRMAERIVVMHEGRVVEVGTHADLLAAGGRYAELFELQARAYR